MCGCWEPNPDPAQGQHESLLIPEPSLQPHDPAPFIAVLPFLQLWCPPCAKRGIRDAFAQIPGLHKVPMPPPCFPGVLFLSYPWMGKGGLSMLHILKGPCGSLESHLTLLDAAAINDLGVLGTKTKKHISQHSYPSAFWFWKLVMQLVFPCAVIRDALFPLQALGRDSASCFPQGPVNIVFLMFLVPSPSPRPAVAYQITITQHLSEPLKVYKPITKPSLDVRHRMKKHQG